MQYTPSALNGLALVKFHPTAYEERIKAHGITHIEMLGKKRTDSLQLFKQPERRSHLDLNAEFHGDMNAHGTMTEALKIG